MDDRTERLRDIFMDVAEEGTVTESQTEQRGTLAAEGDDDEARLAGVIEAMTERFDFETDLDVAEYADVVRGFYQGRDDEAIAEDLDVSSATVYAARGDLHLLRAADAPAVDLEALRDRIADGESPESAARSLGAEAAEAERAGRVAAAQDRSRRVSHRYRSEFEAILTDADLSVRLAAGAREDGLAEATADAEVDVDF